jgi:hypothetical protein
VVVCSLRLPGYEPTEKHLLIAHGVDLARSWLIPERCLRSGGPSGC